MRIRNRRILPATWPSTTRSMLSSFTRNIALGKASTTSPSNSTFSSFGIGPIVFQNPPPPLADGGVGGVLPAGVLLVAGEFWVPLPVELAPVPPAPDCNPPVPPLTVPPFTAPPPVLPGVVVVLVAVVVTTYGGGGTYAETACLPKYATPCQGTAGTGKS